MDYKHKELNDFMEISGLTSSSVKQLTSFLDGYAKEKGLDVKSHEFYSNACEDVAAVICEIECDNVELMADMDIGVATNLAMNDMLLSHNVTAWFTTKKSAIPCPSGV